MTRMSDVPIIHTSSEDPGDWVLDVSDMSGSSYTLVSSTSCTFDIEFTPGIYSTVWAAEFGDTPFPPFPWYED